MSLFNAYLALSGAYDADIERDVPLSKRTSLRIGGPAALVATVHSYHALVRTLEVLEREGVEWAVLGKGTSVLAADKGYDGCVICLGREFARISVDESKGLLSAGAAALLSKVVNAAYKSELSGLEEMVGIPGTVGGAIAMNAGTRHEWIGSKVESVVCLRPGEGLVRYDAPDVEWGYRRTSIPSNEIILEASFSLAHAPKGDVAYRTDKLLLARRQSQPMGKLTCGAVFVNAGDLSAGRLIEHCGLKGFASGGASVSDVHANFVVNNGGATATDVLVVLNEMQQRVKEVHGVELQPKIKFLGFTA